MRNFYFRDFIRDYWPSVTVGVICILMIALNTISVQAYKGQAFGANCLFFLPPIVLAGFHNYYRINYIKGSTSYRNCSFWFLVMFLAYFASFGIYLQLQGGIVN